MSLDYRKNKEIMRLVKIHFDQVDKKRSETLRGRIFSKQHRRGISEGLKSFIKEHGHWRKGINFTKEHREKISLRLRGSDNPMFGRKRTEKENLKTSQSLKEYYKSHPPIRGMLGKKHTEEWKQKYVPALFRTRRPNKSEIFLRDLLNKLFPKEYKYVGDGKVWLGNRNPDFINVNGKKKIIEFFGKYWHEELKDNDENFRINHFRKFGFDTLVVWSNELRDFKKLEGKLIKFHKDDDPVLREMTHPIS